MKRRKKQTSAEAKVPSDEAPLHPAQIDQTELTDFHQELERKEAEVDRYVDDRKRSIRGGARRTGKQFRI
jgi:hypothetical protein